MQPKEISKLKRQMKKACNAGIDNIIEQLIFNEDEHKVKQGDPNATFKAIKLNVKIIMDMEDKDKKTSPFQMGSNPIVDLK